MNKLEHIYKNKNFGEDWFTYPNLYKFAVDKFSSGSTFVEIGSWKGKSSAYMAVEIANSNKDIKFFCVDTWEGSKKHGYIEKDSLYFTFMNNMKDVKNYFYPYRMTSLQASKLFDDNSIDFIFVDGSHEYEDVKDDIISWYPKVKTGGMLSGHDYSEAWPGVKKAVQECFSDFIVNEGCWAIYKNDKKD
jgi:hypothetical protein